MKYGLVNYIVIHDALASMSSETYNIRANAMVPPFMGTKEGMRLSCWKRCMVQQFPTMSVANLEDYGNYKMMRGKFSTRTWMQMVDILIEDKMYCRMIRNSLAFAYFWQWHTAYMNARARGL